MGKASEIEQFVIDKVREIRLLKNVSQKQLSVLMGLNGKFVGNVESTKTPDKYNLNHLNKIAEIFECSIKDFFPEKPISGEIERTYPK
ncbi:helix-turn-helix domain-containing protein [Pedobacter sp. R-06]|uniref:helix-turn-helix domain-containing protein n=1 Tax=Pedobacter sp. R-06 TaxID=3404051 RepID=UPI003CFB1D23